MSLISFEFNWNHIYFFLHFLSFFIRHCIINKMPKEEERKEYETKFFNTYIYTFSNFFSILFHLIARMRSKRTKKTENNIKKSNTTLSLELIYSNEKPISFNKLLIRTLLVSISDFAAQYSVFLFYVFVQLDSVKLDLLTIFNILSIYLFSRILLNVHFYKHHKLSFYINLICLMIMGSVDIYNIYPDWNLKVLLFILIKIFSSFCYSFEDVIGKKALTEEFLSPYKLLIYKGVYELLILIISSIPFFFYKIGDQNIYYIFVKNLNSFNKVVLVLLLMITNFAYNVFIWIINERFSPNDLSMVMAVEGFTNKIYLLLFKFDEVQVGFLIYELIFYLILAIGACIHNEIIILYFCNLNEYTKKNINIKSQEDFEFANSYTHYRPSITSENLDINENETKDNIMTDMSNIDEDN